MGREKHAPADEQHSTSPEDAPVDVEAERAARVQGFRAEMVQALLDAYDQRKQNPRASIQLLRTAAEAWCYAMLIAKGQLGHTKQAMLDEMLRTVEKRLKTDAFALRSMQAWGNRAAHAQGRPDLSTSEDAVALFLHSAAPVKWLYREVFKEPPPQELVDRYEALVTTTRANLAPLTPSNPAPLEPPGRVGSSPALPQHQAAHNRRVYVIVGASLVATVVVSVAFFFGGAWLAAQQADPVEPSAPSVSEATRPVTAPVTAPSAAPPSAPTASLDPDDRSFVDTSNGAGWAERCYKHRLAGRLPQARAACLNGLILGPGTPYPRAYLLFELGVIERLTGNAPAARRYLEESQALRPANDTSGRAAVARELGMLAPP